MTTTQGDGAGLRRPRHAAVRSGRHTGGRFRHRAAWLAGTLLVLIAAGAAVLWHQGYRAYVIHTGSMVPTYRPGDLVIDRVAPRHVHVGQVITFRHSDVATDVVTHRVTAITATGLIHTKGDANATADAWEIRPDQVKGSVVGSATGLGYLVVFLRQPAGIGSLAVSIMALSLLWGLFFPPQPESSPADSVGGQPRSGRARTAARRRRNRHARGAQRPPDAPAGDNSDRGLADELLDGLLPV